MTGTPKTISILLALMVMAGCAAQPASPGGESLPAWDNPSAPAQSASHSPEAPELPTVETIRSATPALLESIAQHKLRYPDTVGWLQVPGTAIDSAVVQGSDYTNEYYLNHDLDGNPDKNGTYSIHHSCRMAPGTRSGISRNTTIFAHNHDDDPDGILFAQLKRFEDPAFAREHPYLFFSATGEDMAWEIFAVFHTVKQFEYIVPDPSWWRMGRILNAAVDASVYDYGITPGREDRILTLSTCTFAVPGVGQLPTDVQNDYRFVIMARLVSPDEPLRETAGFTQKTGFLLPDDFPLRDDSIAYDGRSYNLYENTFDNPCIRPIDRSALILKGRIARTTDQTDFADWDATYLPAGTEVYYDPEYPMTFVVDIDGETLPYSPLLENMQARSEKLLLLQGDQPVHERNVGEELLPQLRPIVDMAGAQRLGGDEPILPHDSEQRIIMELHLPVYCLVYEYSLGTPSSLGEEVMIARQSDGLYYKSADLFYQLLELFPQSPQGNREPPTASPPG